MCSNISRVLVYGICATNNAMSPIENTSPHEPRLRPRTRTTSKVTTLSNKSNAANPPPNPQPPARFFFRNMNSANVETSVGKKNEASCVARAHQSELAFCVRHFRSINPPATSTGSLSTGFLAPLSYERQRSSFGSSSSPRIFVLLNTCANKMSLLYFV